MDKFIWKYEITPSSTGIKMPKHAQVLSVQMQNDIPCIWALVDPKAELVEKHFEIFGTGHIVPCEGISRAFIGTFQIFGGSLVFHLFERL